MINTVRALGLIVGLVLFGGLAAAAEPAAAHQMAFDIPAQQLRDALNDFGRQAGLSIAFYDDAVKNRKARALAGSFTPQAALALLLRDSSLRYEFVNESTVAIRAAAAASQGEARDSPGATDRSRAMTDSLRLAKTDEATGPVAAGVVAQPDGESSPEHERTSVDQTAAGKGIPEILVKGKRSSNTDIRRTEDDVQPYVVFDAEDIERSMAGTLEEFLKTRLPMNTVGTSNSQNPFTATGNQSSIDLRGLGTDQTLVLVNGRRMPGVSSSLSAGFSQVDINGIAPTAVERIEVLPSTAGGIYGGGATGGVINVILKEDYQGVDIGAAYDNVFSGDAAKRRIEAHAGFNLEGGRTSVQVTASYADANVLAAGERNFAARARKLQLQSNPQAFYDPFTFSPPYGATPNIRSADRSELRLKTGEALGDYFAYVPVGYAGTDSDDGQAFLETAGQYNLDLPRDLTGTGQALLSDPRVRSASVNLRRNFGSRVEAFVDASYYDNESRFLVGGLAGNLLYLPEGASNNPFDQAIEVQFPTPGETYGGGILATSETRRAGGGIIIRLPREWTLQGEYGWSRSRYTSSSNSFYSEFFPSLTFEGQDALADGTLDVLRDPNRYPLDFSPYYYMPAHIVDTGPNDTVLQDGTLRLAGPVARLPAGAMTVSALIERREQQARASLSTRYYYPETPYYVYYAPRRQAVNSLYVETNIPLFSATQEQTGVRSLDVQMSARYDHYRTKGIPTNFSPFVNSPDGPFPEVDYDINTVAATRATIGLRYSPAAALTLRLSYGGGFLPPSISQIAPNVRMDFTVRNVQDPKRGDSDVGVVPTYITSGNPDLQPEDSKSWSAGMIITPEAVPGLRLSLDYTRIDKEREIIRLSDQTFFDLEDVAFPDRIMRGELTPEDMALGYTAGPVLSFDDSLVNLSTTRLEAYDLQLDQRWSTRFGSFNAYALATLQPTLKRRSAPGASAVEYVGYSGGVLEWRGNGGVNWQRANWTFGWNVQYYDTYQVYSATESSSLQDERVLNQGSATIASQMYHDLFFRYRQGRTPASGLDLLSNIEVTAGISNILNTSPPIRATIDPLGGYSAYGDPRLRRYTLAVTKRF